MVGLHPVANRKTNTLGHGHYGRYDHTYGDLGAAVGFLTWVWLSLVILLTGAEILCEAERQK